MSLLNLPIPASLEAGASRCMERFDEACRVQQLSVPSECTDLLKAVFAVSQFVADTAAAQPRWFLAECPGGALEPRTRAYFDSEFNAALDGITDAVEAFAHMRQLRNRELARIAWRDIVAEAPVMEITAELSAFADAAISQALEWVTAQNRARFGLPFDEQGQALSMNVIGMGKLGGGELNFSSDIDLIFAYAAPGATQGGRREVSNQEYFDKLGQALIALLGDTTSDGFVFRVDMRLRPFGGSGPLSSNFGALEHYYQLHGRDWERYAFIKARIVAGGAASGERLQKILKPFVYRRYLDFGALEAVRDMKALIDAEVARKDLAMDVKLGAGGIREIEFIGQTFQLIRGGREPLLQQRPILEILKACAQLKLLDADDAAGLRDAYLFLRRTEHRLQQVADRQTHQIPTVSSERDRLAYSLGFRDFDEFRFALERHRDIVRRCFRALLRPEEDVDDARAAGATLSIATRLWRGDGDTSDCVTLGFDDADVAAEVIEKLSAPQHLNRLSREGRERLNRLMPHLIETTATRVQSATTLVLLADLVRAVARRSVYLSLLADRPATLERLIDLYHASPWIARQITQQPLLLDELLDPRVLYSPPDRDQLVELLATRRNAIEPDDIERMMDMLRDFKNQQVLRVAASDITQHFPVAEVSNQLSYIAEALLHHALEIARDILDAKHGAPHCRDGEAMRKVGFAIVAYGKLGGLELGYGSDLDLVFLHDGTGEQPFTVGERAIDNGVYFTRLTQRIIHFLNTNTAAGRAYEVDTRLRPSGEAGLLVSSVEAFANYQNSEAWTWEHQALIRARAVAGDPACAAGFEKIRRATLSRRRDPSRLRQDILEMRTRMHGELDRSDTRYFDLKQGQGGITDIEFMVQYCVLKEAHDHQELLEFSDNLRLLEVLTRLGLISAARGASLHDAYFAYRAEVHRCALQEIDGLVPQNQFQAHRTAVTAAWHAVLEID